MSLKSDTTSASAAGMLTALRRALPRRRQEPVQLIELGAAPELAVVLGGLAPRYPPRGRDVPAAQRALLGVVRHVRALPGVLLGRADVDERLIAENAQHVL